MTDERSEKLRVLFICVHNSGRSQMDEVFLKALAGDRLKGDFSFIQTERLIKGGGFGEICWSL